MSSSEIVFQLDRTSRVPLVRQLADALRRAIVGGEYAPGSVLPTLQEIAKASGVSLIVVRQAVKQLANEGLVTPRPGVGCIVPQLGQKVMKGHVLVVVPGNNEIYYINILIGELQARLMKSGYRMTLVTAPWVGNDVDLSHLKLALAQSYDLVLTIWPRPGILSELSASGLPYVVFREAICEAEGCVGTIRYLDNGVVPDFALHCRAAGVRSVWQFRLHEVGPNAIDMLKALNIRARDVVLDFLPGCTDHLEGASLAGLKWFDDYFDRQGRKGLPEVLLFGDDYVASGAILSLMSHGVRIPEDVRLVTLRNKGLGLIYPKSLARMELDPSAHAAKIADYLTDILRGNPLPEDACVMPTYIRGETFA